MNNKWNRMMVGVCQSGVVACAILGFVAGSPAVCRAGDGPCGGAGERACCCFGDGRNCLTDPACTGNSREVVGCGGANQPGCGGCSSSWCAEITPCGGAGQRACCCIEDGQCGCDAGLVEEGNCKDELGWENCGGCSLGVCVDPACGGEGQRACCVLEGAACGAGLVQGGSCADILGSNNCDCVIGLGSSIGVCIAPTHCGNAGERACCFGEDGVLDGCRGSDLIQDSAPTCAEKFGTLDCYCASGVLPIGWCREKPGVGEECIPVLNPCKPGLLCNPVGVENGLIQYACFADLDDVVSREECNTFYNPNVHNTAINGNITLNFGYGAAGGAGVQGSIENGVVYGRDGCFGCYQTQCTGFELSVGISAFVTVGEGDVDVVCDPNDAGCLSFDGQACVTTQGASIPVVDIFGISGSQVWANCDSCLPFPVGPCLLVAAAQTFSIGIGLDTPIPIDISGADCTTIMTVAGCINADGVYTAITNEPPVCNAGGPYEVECNGSSPTVVLASASTDPDGDVMTNSWSSSGCSGSAFSSSTAAAPTYSLNGLTSCSATCDVSLTVSDAEEASSCSTTVKIKDTTPPGIDCPANQTIECSASADTSVAANGSATGTDTCDPSVGVASSDTTVTGCGYTKVISRQWTATDDCGLSSSCSQSIEVEDSTPPSIDTAAAGETVECDGAGNTAELNDWLAALGGASASDACGSVSWGDDFSALSNGCGATGAATVTFTATDECSLKSTTSATFTIEDTTAPTFTSCPGTTYHLSPAGRCTDAVSYSVTAGDTCGSTAIACVGDNAGASSVTSIGGSFPVGTTNVTCTATDDCGLTSQCSFDVVVNDPPRIVSVTPATQMVQYSDKIVPVVVTATDCGPASSLSLEFDAADVPAGLALSSTADSCGLNASNLIACTWTLDNNDRVLEPGGEYVIDNIKAVDPTPLNGVTLKSSPARTITVQVKAENATIAFDGSNPVAVQVEADGGTSGVFDLSVDVQELLPELVTAGGNLPGDIGLAVISLTLVPVGPGSPVVGICTPDNDPTPLDYNGVLTATCSFVKVPVNTYTVEALLVANDDGDKFYSGSNEDVLVVFDPSLGFTTGGGHIAWPGTGDRTNWGYTMKYNKKQTSIQGSLLLIRHLPDGTRYRVKSNALYGLAIGDEGDFGWASFAGKCTYQDPSMLEPEGNHQFVTYVEDHAEPGVDADRFWIQLFDKDDVLIGALSIPDPATANAEYLTGGNIVVPHQPRNLR